MLIKSYGEFWNPDIIDWGSKGKGNSGSLMGKVKLEKTEGGTSKKYSTIINFWNAKGIYVLYNDYEPIYVGKAFLTPLGIRLRDHLTDRLAGRWEMFSWFSLSIIRQTKNDVSQPGKRTINPETINNTLEALAIIISDPKLNRRRESIKDAVEAIQSERPDQWTIRHYLEKILENTEPKNNQ